LKSLNKVLCYFPQHLFDINQRDLWFELIKSKDRYERKKDPLDERIQSLIEWTEEEEKAHLWFLPMDWQYYRQEGTMEAALSFCLHAKKRHKLLWSFNGFDHGVELKVPENVRVYRTSMYRSSMSKNDVLLPFFLSDPIHSVLGISEEQLFEAQEGEPIIGFCGMAPHGIKTRIHEYALALTHNISQWFTRYKLHNRVWYSTSVLRHKVLRLFEKHPRCKTNFIRHKKYRAGALSADERRRSAMNYYSHMLSCDFIICIRGAGNFSVRFYETLAMGRIPIFIDTDCILPALGSKSWHNYLLRIDEKDRMNAAELFLDWIKGKDITELKMACRQLWKDHLRRDHFWMHEINKLMLT
jgi:hypothetical protein